MNLNHRSFTRRGQKISTCTNRSNFWPHRFSGWTSLGFTVAGFFYRSSLFECHEAGWGPEATRSAATIRKAAAISVSASQRQLSAWKPQQPWAKPMASRVPMPAGLEIASCTAMFLGNLGLDLKNDSWNRLVPSLGSSGWIYVAMNWIDIGKMEIKGHFVDF